MRFPKQESWSGLPVSPPGDFPDPEVQPMSPASPALAGRFFTTEPSQCKDASDSQGLMRLRQNSISSTCPFWNVLCQHVLFGKPLASQDVLLPWYHNVWEVTPASSHLYQLSQETNAWVTESAPPEDTTWRTGAPVIWVSLVLSQSSPAIWTATAMTLKSMKKRWSIPSGFYLNSWPPKSW